MVDRDYWNRGFARVDRLTMDRSRPVEYARACALRGVGRERRPGRAPIRRRDHGNADAPLEQGRGREARTSFSSRAGWNSRREEITVFSWSLPLWSLRSRPRSGAEARCCARSRCRRAVARADTARSEACRRWSSLPVLPCPSAPRSSSPRSGGSAPATSGCHPRSASASDGARRRNRPRVEQRTTRLSRLTLESPCPWCYAGSCRRAAVAPTSRERTCPGVSSGSSSAPRSES